jgi:virginiamycin B lyase
MCHERVGCAHDLCLSRRRGVAATIFACATLALAGCGSFTATSSDREEKPHDVVLPRGAYPSHLALSRDGSLWVSESGEAIARLRPNGKLRQYRLPGSENDPGDLEEGPDGGIWIAGFEEFIRVDPRTGSVGIGADFGPSANPEVGLPDAVAPGPDGATWFAEEVRGLPMLLRVESSGATSLFPIPGAGEETAVHGMALGPDGAIWMTLSDEFDSGHSEIGRFDVSGRLTSWSLPQAHSPGQIIKGPDAALWFTEADHRIGRITTKGEISEYVLRPGLAVYDIAGGPGQSLWFTTAKRVGRIDASGRASTWLVSGADSLFGVAAAPNGGAWVADGPADRIRYFKPPS